MRSSGMKDDEQPSPAQQAYHLTALFEAELLVQLMLWKWEHPLADDSAFTNNLLEGAAEVLRKCVQDNKRFLDEVDPRDMNFVAAVWYAEWAALQAEPHADPGEKRLAWLKAVRHSLPSCFCDPADLQ
jgi:hypothetical protein